MTDNVMRRLGRDPGIIIIKRGFAISYAYIPLAVLFVLIAMFVANLGAFLHGVPGGSGYWTAIPLLSVGLNALAALMLTTPVLMLYVYDKNNGVLEYFLSLGMDQGDIFKRYLKAGLILVVLLMVAIAITNVVLALILRGDVIFPLAAAGLAAALSLAIISLETMAMMAFSSLQKQRAGANQPLGLALGGLLVMPVYIPPYILPFIVVVVVDLVEAAIIAALSIALFLISSRLISREKLLP